MVGRGNAVGVTGVRSIVGMSTLGLAAVLSLGPAAWAGTGAPPPTGTVVHGLIEQGAVSQVEPPEKLAALQQVRAGNITSGAVGATAAAVMASRVLTVATQVQQTPYWCSPASGRTALSALVASTSLPSQTTLASRMGTTSAGTVVTSIGPALNAYQSKNYYVYVNGLLLDAYRSRVQTDIGTYGAPLNNPVEMSRLPWYAGTGISGGHDIATYGYYTATKYWQMHVHDPWDNIRHTYVNSGTLYDASISHSLIW